MQYLEQIFFTLSTLVFVHVPFIDSVSIVSELFSIASTLAVFGGVAFLHQRVVSNS